MTPWISLILPIASTVRDLVALFQRDYGRVPTDAELAELLASRMSTNASWAETLERIRSGEIGG